MEIKHKVQKKYENGRVGLRKSIDVIKRFVQNAIQWSSTFQGTSGRNTK